MAQDSDQRQRLLTLRRCAGGRHRLCWLRLSIGVVEIAAERDLSAHQAEEVRKAAAAAARRW
jgi:hypothetical protein